MQEAERLAAIAQRQQLEASRTCGMFRYRTANEVMKEAAAMPDPVELYPRLRVEGETNFLFADTGIGKTIYAVQMAIEIAKKYKVLYIDLELSDKQFYKRYRGADGTLFHFPENFIRVDMTPLFSMPEGIDYSEHFLQSLRELIRITGAKIVIIDNMTKLVAGDTDSARNAIPILDKLHQINRLEGISFLIIEHNKKVDDTRPISLNDLQGSKMKANFADAIFSIGRSHSDKYIRYVKQLKVRNADLVYDTDNVMMCELMNDEGFLHFKTMDYVSEYSLLKQPDDSTREAIIQKVKEMSTAGQSQRNISRELHISLGAVNKYLKL